jgi:hypothetical protein
MILSSTVKEMRVFHNSCDLSVCSFGRGAHANYLDANVKPVLMTKSLLACNSYGDYFFHNLDKFFVKSFNYTTKGNLECNENLE